MESVLHNSGSATGSINCPKCGYVQEKRLDCKKCGIVFSKYYALYPSSQSADAAPAEASHSQELSAQDLQMLLSDLQAQVQVLSGRFAEVEFEKAERNQIRMDLKNLERQVFENMQRLGNRLENPMSPQVQQENFDPRLPEIRERLEQLESKLGSSEFAGQYLVEVSEKSESNSRQIVGLQQQLADLRKDLGNLKGELDIISQAQKAQEPQPPLEEDVRAIRKNLDDLRAYLSRVPTS